MAFDPDKFLEETSGAGQFDPDKFLSETSNVTTDESYQPSEGIASHVFNSAMMNFGDEAAGTLAKGIRGTYNAVTGEPLDTGFNKIDEGTRREMAMRQKYAQEHPIISGASDLAGMAGGMAVAPIGKVGTGVANFANKARFIPTWAANVLGGAATGATVGGIYGAGEDNGDRIENSKSGAEGGALFGGALSAAGQIAAPTLKSLGRIVKGATAEDIFQDIAGKDLDKIKNSLEYNKSPLEPYKSEMVAAETNPYIAKATRAVKASSPEASDIIESNIQARQNEQLDRVTKAINENIANRGYLDNLDEIQKVYAPIAQAKYQEAFEKPIQMTPQLKSVLDFADKNNLLKTADTGLYAEATNTGQTPSFTSANLSTNPKTVPTSYLDALKKTLDAKIDYAQSMNATGEEKALNNAYQTVNANLKNIMDNQNPAYASARSAGMDTISLRNAQQFGKDAFKRNITNEEVRNTVSGYSDAQKEAALVGARDYLLEQATRGTPSKVFNNKNVQTQLSALMGKNNPRLKAFNNTMNQELQAYNAWNKIKGGSETYENFKGEQALNPIDVFQKIKHPISSTMDYLSAKSKGLDVEQSQRLAKALTEKPAGIDMLRTIDAMNLKNQDKQKLLQKMLSTFGQIQ